MNKTFVESLDQEAIDLKKLKNTKILITGANGLIASNLAEALYLLGKKYNIELYLLCRNKEKAEKRFSYVLRSPSVHLLIQDVVEPLNLDEEFDYIFHAASAAHPGAFNTVPADVMKANFIGTMNLLDYCKGKKTRFIFVSSSEVYGENFEGVEYFDETMNGSVNPTVFRSCYPESKRASETLCMCYKKQYNSDVVVVRPAFIYVISQVFWTNFVDGSADFGL